MVKQIDTKKEAKTLIRALRQKHSQTSSPKIQKYLVKLVDLWNNSKKRSFDKILKKAMKIRDKI